MTAERLEWLDRLLHDRRAFLAAAVFWAAVLLILVLLIFLRPQRPQRPQPKERLVARVTVGGVQVLAIDLYEDGLIECSAAFLENEVEKKRSDLYFDLGSVGAGAVLRLKNDRQICVDHSDCRDQACVKCGYIGQLDQTIECEEDKLKVEIIEKTVL